MLVLPFLRLPFIPPGPGFTDMEAGKADWSPVYQNTLTNRLSKTTFGDINAAFAEFQLSNFTIASRLYGCIDTSKTPPYWQKKVRTASSLKLSSGMLSTTRVDLLRSKTGPSAERP